MTCADSVCNSDHSKEQKTEVVGVCLTLSRVLQDNPARHNVRQEMQAE